MSAQPGASAGFVSHLECGWTGERHDKGVVHGLSNAGKPLLVRYDLEALGRALTQEALRSRPFDGRDRGFWRYREFLPVENTQHELHLGEVVTPLIDVSPPGAPAGTLWIKDEGRLPTASFKSRGLALAVAMAKQLGAHHLAMPTNGNAGAALAAYARRAGLAATVLCPADTPEINVREIAALGADVFRVDGLIDECGAIVRRVCAEQRWFDVSTLKEPYRIEGKKTMGLELWEQTGGALPDVILYPTGGGTGLIGMWKAFDELERLGWLHGKKPRMVAVQASGCAPIVNAFEEGTRCATRVQNATTVAAGIRVPAAIGDFLILDAVRESGGFAIAVDDDHILQCRERIALQSGNLLCPEGAATIAAYEAALQDGRIDEREVCVAFNCASGIKYELPAVTRHLDKEQSLAKGRLVVDIDRSIR
ncbi:MAG: threonine synthase [Planctomycetes bacterium]|nr:threonine synthase [Planctomycetota bacterium]MCB9918964.1 threonine synthase [Planctomycetota bacterium]